jgi:AcrR family transcriptional regulator
VLEHQRLRLHGAMIEAVAEHGYAAVSVQRLVRLAGVSKRSFYELFPSKQECFLATFDVVLADGLRTITAADRSQPGADARLRALFAAAADHAARRPKHVRLCLLEALAAGPGARERLESARASVQLMVARSLTSAFGEQAPPPFAIAAIVHGVWHLTRARLLSGELERLPECADELCEWVVSHRATVAAPPPIVAARALVPPPGPPRGDTRARLRRAALELVGRRGRRALTAEGLSGLAGVEPQELIALYGDVEACFLDALDLLAAEALAAMLPTTRGRAGDWPATVHAAVAALLDWIARDPALARVAFVETLRAGPDALARSVRLLDGFARLLARSAPPERRPAPVVAEAVVGAVWGTLHDYLAAGAIDRLTELAEPISQIVLAGR